MIDSWMADAMLFKW